MSNFLFTIAKPNPAVDIAPFGRWTLRDKAAQRRSALRWAPMFRMSDNWTFSTGDPPWN